MNYPQKKLIEICTPKQWPTIPMKNLGEEGFPVYGANGIIGYYHEYNHENPTIMITCRGATCGTVNVCTPKSYVTGNAMCLDDLNEEIVDLGYLRNFLVSRGFNDVITGSAQPQITRTNLSRIRVSLPPLEEQKKIAVIIDKANKIKENSVKVNEIRGELISSIFIDMFGNINTNDKNWPIQKLSTIALDIKDGTHFSPDLVEHGVPYVTSKHISGGIFDFYSKPMYISEEAHSDIYKRCDVKKDDLLLVKDGVKTGVAVVNPVDWQFSLLSSVAMIRCNLDLINFNFLCSLINQYSYRQYLRSKMGGAAIKRLTLRKINDLDIMLPPIELQNKFVSIFQLIQKIPISESLTENNLKSIIQELLT
jgi:type I restriction enzyme, S subunit